MATPRDTTITTQSRTIDGLSIRYAESVSDHDDHVLLTNPWPESLYAYHAVWPALSQNAHLLAVDLPGFGHSERRDDLLSPSKMADFLIRLLDEFELENPHLVCPDVGTAASLFAAARHPGRLRSLIVGSGGAMYPLHVTGALKSLIEAPDMDSFRAIDSREILRPALTGMNADLPEDVLDDYLSSYDGDRFVESAAYVRSYPQDLPVLAELLPSIKTPVQIITGTHDDLVPPANAEFLHERLPKSKLDILNTGHFVWEEAADAYAVLATTWWAGGYADTSSDPQITGSAARVAERSTEER
jgi:pimeloyl-ACP methyl ester carboxylesterase